MRRDRVYILLLTGLIFFSVDLSGQEPVPVNRTSNKVILEGKVYYVHVVKAGQTLYSIARAYNVTEKEILIENPGSSSDLIVGQVLKIPSDPARSFDADSREIASDSSIHILQEGETIYAISRKYNTTVEQILELNPGIDINDLAVGSKIKIPMEIGPKNEMSFDEEGVILHKVKRGETLYSIARYYDVSIREIRNENTKLRWGGPRSGDILRIPQPNTTAEEVFTPDDTISSDSLLLPEEQVLAQEIDSSEIYDYDDLFDRFTMRGKTFKVAYFIPFNYSEMEPLDSLLKDVRSAIRRERIKQDYMIDAATPQSVRLLEFLEGSLMAIDSMSDAGMNLDIRVFDTKRSMYRTRMLLADPEMEDMDLIIGPFFSYNLELVADFASKNRIPVVTPFHSNDSLVADNPYLIQPTPSLKTEYDRNAEYISRLYDNNLVFIHDGDSSNLPMVSYYKEKLFEALQKYSVLETVLFKEVIVQDGNTDLIRQSLNSDMKNLVILPATDEAFASLVASRLYYELENFDIQLFGSSYWVGFDDIDINYIHDLSLVISQTYWYDYKNPEFLHFLEKFRNNYINEPIHYYRQGCNFAVSGYDLTLYFLSALEQYGKRFIARLDRHEMEETLHDFSFERVNRKGGYTNTGMKFFKFGEELKVEVAELPEQPPVHHHLRPAGEDPLYYGFPVAEPDSAEVTVPAGL